jgi:beta-aspartyl-peptidase (threonine type)
VKYQGVDLGTAANAVINEKLVQMGGDGGIIGLDPQGGVVYAFNTTGMYRASIDTSGQLDVRIFR